MTAGLLLGLILAQAPAAEAAETARLERIRQALAEPPAITTLPATSDQGTVFRLTVFGRKPAKPVWDNWSAVPTYIRPWFRGDHHEFLERVTPEEFRGPTLYPVGIPVLAVAGFLAKRVNAANRKKQERNAKEEVRQALEELLACRADPARPGC